MHIWNEFVNSKMQQRLNPKVRFARSYNGGKYLITVNNQAYLNFTSNDYLGLSLEKKLQKALIDNMAKYGIGSTGAPSLSGYSQVQEQLELEMASWLGFDSCLVFNSGYHVGIGILKQLADNQTTIWIDKNCHASHIDGVLLARTKFKTFKSEDILTVIRSIQKASDFKHIVVTEGSFSMDGTCAYLDKLIELRQESSNVLLIIDDAHGIGALGIKSGFGTMEQLNLDHRQVDLLIGTFAKSFGSYGGFICGNSNLINYLKETSRSQIYSSCLPPLIHGVNLASLDIIKSHTGKLLRQGLINKIEYFKLMAKQCNLLVKENNYSPIQLLMFKDINMVSEIHTKLLNSKILVGKMLYPTVAKTKPRLRISLNTNLEQNDIELLCHTIRVCI